MEMNKVYIHLGNNPIFLQGQVTLHHKTMTPEPYNGFSAKGWRGFFCQVGE